jgi:hypothetical protein
MIGPSVFHGLIVEAALKNRTKRFVIDDEAVVLSLDGMPDFNALHSGKHNDEVQFCAFDVLALDGEDLRNLPLSMRKTNLERLLRGRPDGIFVNPFESGAIGPDLFRAACDMGLEGSLSAATVPIGAAGRRIGSRSRTGSIRLLIASRRRSRDYCVSTANRYTPIRLAHNANTVAKTKSLGPWPKGLCTATRT